jgi:hypothetical protein
VLPRSGHLTHPAGLVALSAVPLDAEERDGRRDEEGTGRDDQPGTHAGNEGCPA